MTDAVLTINAGSSSIKFKLLDTELRRIASGEVDKIGIAPNLTIRDAHGAILVAHKWDQGSALTHETLLEPMLDWVRTHLGSATLLAAGHRIVHGGRDFSGPVRLDPATFKALEAAPQCP